MARRASDSSTRLRAAARPSQRSRSVLALRVPADESMQGEILDVIASAAALSDAIGGGLLEDAVYGRVDGQDYCVYLDEEREVKRLPGNRRAERLARLLGWSADDPAPTLLGDILITGVGPHGDDADVPDYVLGSPARRI
jgi:hypothetical protein